MANLAVLLRRFGADQSGAIAIDWVALTSGLLLLGISVVYAIFNGGVSSVVGDVNLTLTELGSGIAGDYSENSASGDSTAGDGGAVATGSASQRACSRTLKYVVCVGNK